MRHCSRGKAIDSIAPLESVPEASSFSTSLYNNFSTSFGIEDIPTINQIIMINVIIIPDINTTHAFLYVSKQ